MKNQMVQAENSFQMTVLSWPLWCS